MFRLIKISPLAARWNSAQSGGQNNRCQLPREQKYFVLTSRLAILTSSCKGPIGLISIKERIINSSTEQNVIEEIFFA